MKQFVCILTFDRGFGGTWSKGATLQEAFDKLRTQSGVKPLGQEYPTIIYQAVLKEETTEEEAKKLQTFWNVGEMGGMFKCDDLTMEDDVLIKDRFIGWLTNEYIPVKIAKKAEGQKRARV